MVRRSENGIRGYWSLDWLAVGRDQSHPAAAAFAAELAKKRSPLLTTNYVLLESYTRIRYDDGHAKAMIFDGLIQEMVRSRQLTITWITPNIHARAMEAFRKYSDQELSVVDCSSFIVAKARKIREVFGFDNDFAKLGFILRP
jgi:predicted nucleic acid-binding protein